MSATAHALDKLLASARASLHLVDGQLLLVWKDAKERQYKFVSPAALRTAISREPVDSGWISPAVRRCGSGARGDWAVAWYGPQTATLTVVDARQQPREISVPLPALLFIGVGKTYSVFATKGKRFSADAACYRAPLPNVGADGGICFGSNVVPSAGAATIERAFAVFLESAFNGHMADGKSTSHADDVRALLFKLAKAKAKAFPSDELVAAKTSVDRAVSALVGRGAR